MTAKLSPAPSTIIRLADHLKASKSPLVAPGRAGRKKPMTLCKAIETLLQARIEIERQGFVIDREIPAMQTESEAAMFDAMDIIGHVQTEARNFAIGYLDGKLVYCDGKKYRRVSLSESASLFSMIANSGSSHGNGEIQAKWLSAIARRLGKAGR